MESVIFGILFSVAIIAITFVITSWDLYHIKIKPAIEARKQSKLQAEFEYVRYANWVADLIYNCGPDVLWKYTDTKRKDIIDIIRNKRIVKKSADQFKREGKSITEAGLHLGKEVTTYCQAQANVM